MVSWGTNPGMASGVDANVPRVADGTFDAKELTSALEYMGLKEGMPIEDIEVNTYLLVLVQTLVLKTYVKQLA